MSNKLLRKDADLFKTVVSSYEGKQYRRGLKAADTILKKHPNHGETLAMKGIILNSMGKKEEAFDLVKLGLRNDVRSPICWHVFGLLHRSDGNYKEAAKCYLNALRIDADNQNILRDLSWLQVQTRDFNGFLSSRKRLLELKPSVRGSWIAYAVACHMKGENAKACEVISKYFDSLLDEVDPYEDSELLLFQNELIEAQGQYHVALQHLDNCSTKIVDKFIFRIRRARLLLFMGDFAGSFEIWKSLVMEQTENLDFHVGLQCSFLRLESSPTFLKQRQLPIHSLCLEDDQKTNLLQVYDTLSLSSRICIKIKLVLSFNLQNSKNSAFRRFLEDSLIHGIPSLAEDLCSLASVLSSIHSSLSSRELCLCWIDEIQEIMTQSTSPIVSFWGMYLKSQLYVFLGDIRSALRQLDFCINHTPTAIDAYTRKSELLESCGKFTEAAELANECRSFDLQDRYLNNFATLRFLRADAVSAALDTISIFTKHDGEPEKTLKDLQCSWYELELAESLAREKRWSHSIQKFLCVREHFIEESNDLFDFHSYCVRKSTLRAYIDAFGVAERLFQHPFYQRACRGALRILLHLNECPEDVDGLGHLSAADRKKERLKLKKKRVKSDNSEEEAPKTSEEFNIANCLSDALEWSRRVDGCLRACDGETLALIAELHMRRNKPIPAMRVLVVGYTIDRFNPDVCTSLTRFVMRMRSKKFVGMSDGVVAHIKLFLHQFFLLDTSPASLSTFLGAFATEAIRISSFTHVIAAAKAELTIDKKSVPETLTWLIGQGQLCNLKNYNARIGQEFHKFLISIDYHQHEVVEKFQSMLLSPDM